MTEKDYVRLPKRSERQQLQKKTFHLPQFPTTTIGSFPQTKDVKQNRAAFRKEKSPSRNILHLIRKKLRMYKEAGRNWTGCTGTRWIWKKWLVEYFGEALGGFLFTEKAWVQSYGTRCVKPPVIWGTYTAKSRWQWHGQFMHSPWRIRWWRECLQALLRF